MNEKSQVVLKSKGPASLQKYSFSLYHILQFRIQKNLRRLRYRMNEFFLNLKVWT